MRDDKNPLALAHPRALRACARLREWTALCARVARGSFIVLVVCVVAIFLWPIAVVAFWALVLSVCMYLVFTVLRLAIIALFFMRYSLRQLMTVILTGGACMTAIIQFPGPWKALPFTALVVLVLLVVAFIAGYDPEDPLFTTDFIRKIYGSQDGGAGVEQPDQPDEESRSPVDREDDRGRVPRA